MDKPDLTLDLSVYWKYIDYQDARIKELMEGIKDVVDDPNMFLARSPDESMKLKELKSLLTKDQAY